MLPFVTIILFGYFSFSFEIYEINETILGVYENRLLGLFEKSQDRLRVVIEGEKILELQQPNIVEKKVKINNKGGAFSLKIISISENINLIAFGEYLLYFADDNYQVIGTPIEYKNNEIDQLFSGSVLRVYEDRIFFIYTISTDIHESSIKSYSYTYKFNLDILNFEPISRCSEYIKTDEKYKENTSIFKCNTFLKGAQFICIITTKGSVLYGRTIETHQKCVITEDDLAGFGEETEIVKLNEEMGVFIEDYFGSVEFFYFAVELTKYSVITTVIITASQVVNQIYAARIDENTLVFPEIQADFIIFHLISYHGAYDVTLNSFRMKVDEPSEFRIITLYEKNINFLLKEKNKNIRLVSFDIPSCNEFSIGMASRTTISFDLSELSPDYKYVQISSVISNGGNGALTKDQKIKFVSEDFGEALIDYSLIEKGTEPIKTKYCRISIQVCNPACQYCNEFSSDNSNPSCTKCGEDYYPLEDNSLKCLKSDSNPEMYLFDSKHKIFKKCYQTCQYCESVGSDSDHHCTKCKEFYDYDKETKNCNCRWKDHMWYRNDKGDFICVDSCPPSNPYYNIYNKECTKQCEKEGYNKIYFGKCVHFCPPGFVAISNECKIKSLSSMTRNLEYFIMDLYEYKPVDTLLNSTYEIYEINNQTSKMKNLSVIDFGECEEIVKKHYNIENFLVFKLDLIWTDELANQVEYQLFSLEGRKLKTSVCDGIKITISTPVNRNTTVDSGNLTKEDIYNLTNDFYDGDICTRYTSNDYRGGSTELNKIKYKNISLCEENCEYKGINFETEQVICDCDLKEEISSTKRRYQLNTIANSLKKTITTANFECIKCFSTFINSNIITNVGFLFSCIVGFFEILVFGCCLHFGIAPLVKALDVIFAKKIKSMDSSTKGKSFLSIIEKPNNITLNNQIQSEIDITVQPLDEKQNFSYNQYKKSRLKTKTEIKKKFPSLQNLEKYLSKEEKNEDDPIRKDKNNLFLKGSQEPLKKIVLIYYSFLRVKQPIIFTFFYNDYNLKSVKISIFAFSMLSSLEFGALFYLDDTMGNKTNEKESFGSFLVKKLYPTLCSLIIESLLKLFSLTQSVFEIIEMEKSYVKAQLIRKNFLKFVRFRLVYFFTLEFVFLFMFFYYISVFCSVYSHIQKKLFFDAFIIYSLQMIYPFLVALVNTILRVLAFKFESKLLYLISQLL